jgi:aspartokinase-like uncharacterized kinase
MMPSPDAPLVVKVGGSLFDLPELGPRLRRWLATLPTEKIVLVPGGGRMADVVRDLDQRHRLGEETAHWLALRTLTLHAEFLATLVDNAAVVTDLGACPALWNQGRLPVLDGFAFARTDHGRPGSLPHSWAVTSDSLAARVARVLDARELILLKSMTIPEPTDWREAGRRGWVDVFFAAAIGAELAVRSINFREWRPMT